eukprot:237530-Prymnesium_polylepis.1
MHARGGAVLSLRLGRRADLLLGVLRRQHDGLMACLLCLSSGAMQSDAQCLVSAFGRRTPVV